MVKLSSKNFKTVFFLLGITYSTICFSTIKHKRPTSPGANTEKIKEDILQANNTLKTIKNKLSDLENNLSKNNKSYIKNIKTSKVLQKRIKTLKNSSDDENRQLNIENQKAKKQLVQLVLSSYESNSLEIELSNQLIKSALLKKIKNIQSIIKQKEKVDGQINALINTVDTYRKNNIILLGLINKLETNKQQVLNKYMSVIKGKDQKESKLQAIQKSIVKKIRTKISGIKNLAPPIRGFINYKKHKKGLQFKYRGTKPIMAPEKGTISYTGNLASYGNVIILAHGDDTRSIILGNFVSKRKKGSSVAKGELLGYTKGTRTSYEKLYYEVRKKSKVQNTILLMDRALLKKNNL